MVRLVVLCLPTMESFGREMADKLVGKMRRGCADEGWDLTTWDVNVGRSM